MSNSKKLAVEATKSLIEKLSAKDIELSYFSAGVRPSDYSSRRAKEFSEEEHKYVLPDGTLIQVSIRAEEK